MDTDLLSALRDAINIALVLLIAKSIVTLSFLLPSTAPFTSSFGLIGITFSVAESVIEDSLSLS